MTRKRIIPIPFGKLCFVGCRFDRFAQPGPLSRPGRHARVLVAGGWKWGGWDLNSAEIDNPVADY
ncbi:MAG: hypothetical protein ACYDIC_16765 [Desulfobaccales bacterium]